MGTNVSLKVLDNVADTTETGLVNYDSHILTVTCTAGSCNIIYDGATFYSVAAGNSIDFNLSPGDDINVIATLAATTVYVSGRLVS